MASVPEDIVVSHPDGYFTIGHFYSDRERTEIADTILTVQNLPAKSGYFSSRLCGEMYQAIQSFHISSIVVHNSYITHWFEHDFFEMLIQSGQMENLLVFVWEKIETVPNASNPKAKFPLFMSQLAFYQQCPNLQHVTFSVPTDFNEESQYVMNFAKCFVTGIPIVEFAYAKERDTDVVFPRVHLDFLTSYKLFQYRAIYDAKFPRVLILNITVSVDKDGTIFPDEMMHRIERDIPYQRIGNDALYEKILINNTPFEVGVGRAYPTATIPTVTLPPTPTRSAPIYLND